MYLNLDIICQEGFDKELVTQQGNGSARKDRRLWLSLFETPHFRLKRVIIHKDVLMQTLLK